MTDESPFKEYISVVQDVPPDPTPERLAQRDRLRDALAAGLADALTKDWPGNTRRTTARAIADYLVERHEVARLIAADVRVDDPALADLVAALDAEMAGEHPEYAAIAQLAIAALRKAVRVGPDEGLRAVVERFVNAANLALNVRDLNRGSIPIEVFSALEPLRHARDTATGSAE